MGISACKARTECIWRRINKHSMNAWPSLRQQPNAYRKGEQRLALPLRQRKQRASEIALREMPIFFRDFLRNSLYFSFHSLDLLSVSIYSLPLGCSVLARSPSVILSPLVCLIWSTPSSRHRQRNRSHRLEEPRETYKEVCQPKGRRA